MADSTGAFALQSSQEFKEAQDSAVLMDALREEHVRVHVQD